MSGSLSAAAEAVRPASRDDPALAAALDLRRDLAGQPIYSEPDVNSKPIGMTTLGAAAGSDSGSFVRVLMYSGATGYLPASSIHGYADPDHPGVTCSFRGLNQYGGPVFDLHPPSKR